MAARWARSERRGRWVPATVVAAYVVLAAVALSLLVWSELAAHRAGSRLVMRFSGQAPAPDHRWRLGARRARRAGRPPRRSLHHHGADASPPRPGCCSTPTRTTWWTGRARPSSRSWPPPWRPLPNGVASQNARSPPRSPTAQVGLEQERNRLATLMAELAVAVLVCNVDGRILLYNSAARSMLDDDTAVGLGRSIFDIVDRDLLEHAVARIRAASAVLACRHHLVRRAAAAGPGGHCERAGGRAHRFRAAARRPDRADDGPAADATTCSREFTEATRASLGSIQAAIETVS